MALMLALLIAQSLVLSHVYSHLNGGLAEASHPKARSGSSDFSATAGQMCSECLSSAALLGAASAPDAPRFVAFAAASERVAHAAAGHFQVFRYYAFRSRAPPELS
jgi:hypothetical protein